MPGHRDVPFGITFPEIHSIQIHAILGAAAEWVEESIDVQPGIMVPLGTSGMFTLSVEAVSFAPGRSA